MIRRIAGVTILGGFLAAGLGGCASSPATQFIGLNTQAPTATHRAAQSVKIVPIAVGRIDLPPDLDRLSLVRRTGSNRLDVDDTVQWGGPLGQLIQQTLASDLAARLPPDRVILPHAPRPASGPMRFLLVTFQTFSAGPHNQVTLQAHWTLVNARTRAPVAGRDADIEVQARSAQGGDIAAAMSRALAQLADQVASVVRKPR
jgi:uncharacterized lipoprotein YmbA